MEGRTTENKKVQCDVFEYYSVKEKSRDRDLVYGSTPFAISPAPRR
jgi:hypothetical protein